jgi:mono/diheme cytochrome c family protein
MTKRLAFATAVLGASLALSTQALAQARSEMGKLEYQSTCISCHGPGGKGDGTYSEYLKVKVPDLTTIAQRNNGVFPADRLYEIIDGRADVKGHGPVGMPVWGNVYNDKAAEHYRGFAYSPEQFTRVRIVALIDYIYSLQTRR